MWVRQFEVNFLFLENLKVRTCINFLHNTLRNNKQNNIKLCVPTHY